jgi:hypothetical protein
MLDGGKVEDTGPLTMKRMETIDRHSILRWMNTTRMHIFTHIRPEYQGKSGMPGNDYADGKYEHDLDVGKLFSSAARRTRTGKERFVFRR